MAVVDKIIALMDTLTVAGVNSLPPIRRQQFAQMCRHWAKIADPPTQAAPGTFPKAGIIAELLNGERSG